MNCDEVAQHASAWIDGVLPDADSESFVSHVDSCEVCKERLNELEQLDRRLRDAVSCTRPDLDRFVTRVVNQLPMQKADPIVREPDRRWGLFGFVSALALCLGAIWLSPQLNPWRAKHSSDAGTVSQHPFASVSASTGPILVSPISDAEFTEFVSNSLAVGSKLRTAEHKSELRTSTGTLLRLDANTVLSCPSSEEVVLESDRLMCTSPGSAPEVKIQDSDVTVNVAQGSCDIRCVDSSQTELIALEGNVEISGDDWSDTVDSGTRITISAGQIVNRDRVVHPVIETRWVHELLQMNSSNDAELMKRVDRLWAALGYSKMQNLYVDELRSLGPSCIHPLMAYLDSEDPKHQTDHRRGFAASLVADVAGYDSATQLVHLLGDDDLEVGFQMARALSRITGRVHVVAPHDWKSASPEDREEAVKMWRKWLATRQTPQIEK